MTKSQLNDCINLLEIARGMVQREITMFVCIALDEAIAEKYNEDSSPPSVDRWDAARAYLQSWISSSLQDRITVRSWLITQGIPSRSITPIDLRLYRIRWIDNMIKALERD